MIERGGYQLPEAPNPKPALLHTCTQVKLIAEGLLQKALPEPSSRHRGLKRIYRAYRGYIGYIGDMHERYRKNMENERENGSYCLRFRV